MTKELNFWNHTWPLLAEHCPCDVHFLEYLHNEGLGNQVIFHFGTGEHHIIGKQCATFPDIKLRNEVLGITASYEEYAAYINLVVSDAAIANYYKVIFADIYTLTERLLPQFDLVTLFHLCEFYDAEICEYARLDDTSLVQLFLNHLKLGGLIFFYTGSMAFDRAKKIIKKFEQNKKIEFVGEHGEIVIYQQVIRG